MYTLHLCFERKRSIYGLSGALPGAAKIKNLSFSYLVLTRASLDFCTAKQTSCQHRSFLTASLRCKLIKLALVIVPACSCLLILCAKGPVPTAEQDLLGVTASSVVCPAAQME